MKTEWMPQCCVTCYNDLLMRTLADGYTQESIAIKKEEDGLRFKGYCKEHAPENMISYESPVHLERIRLFEQIPLFVVITQTYTPYVTKIRIN